MSSFVKKMVCSFYKCKSQAIHFDLVNVETQPNSYDCGVYAIANATELAYSLDPALCSWNQSMLRRHLKSCLEQGSISQFPKSGKRKIPFGSRVKHTVLERIYCVMSCRMPNDKMRAMIACDNCREWYHKDCVGLDVHKEYSNVDWKCSDCQGFLSKLCT